MGQRRGRVRPCNLSKGGHLAHHAGMQPRQLPYRPTVFQLHRNGRLFPPNYLHESWLDYLYWDTELEPLSGVRSRQLLAAPWFCPLFPELGLAFAMRFR